MYTFKCIVYIVAVKTEVQRAFSEIVSVNTRYVKTDPSLKTRSRHTTIYVHVQIVNQYSLWSRLSYQDVELSPVSLRLHHHLTFSSDHINGQHIIIPEIERRWVLLYLLRFVVNYHTIVDFIICNVGIYNFLKNMVTVYSVVNIPREHSQIKLVVCQRICNKF